MGVSGSDALLSSRRPYDLGSDAMSKAAENAKLVQVKLALAEKYDHLAKVVKSRPHQKRLRRHAERFRRQAADLARK
jgi:hypothetical protein